MSAEQPQKRSNAALRLRLLVVQQVLNRIMGY